MREIEDLQREIWGVSDLDVLPALALRPQKEVGGILMGAFADKRMVGFVFGFPGILNGETIIHSDMLGVIHEYRSHGVGYLLKCAQREAALEQGVKRITWTFDPLQSRNAHLNFTKLGVVADRYLVNYYGETSSFLHQFGTDRLWVSWLLDSERVVSRVDRNEPPKTPNLDVPALVRVGPNGEPVVDTNLSNRVMIEIPSEANPEVWRDTTRAAFTLALDGGYRIEDFYVTEKKTGVYLFTSS